jgi:hypothetical protein
MQFYRRSILRLLCALAVFAGIGQAGSGQEAAMGESINVRALGAKGDGKADDTPAFEEAIRRAAAGQGAVFVPKGFYRLSKPLTLENIGMRGPDPGAWVADTDALPVLVPQQRDAPCIVMKAGASLKGICIRYDWEREPEAGPPAVLVTGIGAYLSQLKLMYPWDGIMADGENNIGRLNIADVFIVAPRNIGVRVTGTWDVPTVTNVEVWNLGPVPRALEKGIGFDLGKNDLIRMTDCFVFAMNIGFLLRDEIPGCKIRGGTWGVLTGCSTDYCSIGIEVRGENTVSVGGGTYWNHHQSLIVDGERARVRVAGAELKSNGAPAVEVRRADHTVISGCSLLRPMEKFQFPAVHLTGGRVTLTGCHLQSTTEGIVIERRIASALAQGNTIETAAGKAIINRAAPPAKVQVSGNLEIVFQPPPPDPNPAPK